MPNLGDVMPNFEAETTAGTFKFHDFIGDSWTILFSHPADYTPVCTTELSMVQKLVPEFEKRKVKLIALSIDSLEHHKGWIDDIKHYTNGKFDFPIIADTKREIGTKLGMIDPDEVVNGIALTARAVFIIGPDKKMKLSLLYPATTGRNFDEIIRAVDSLQLTATKKVATPVNWKVGDEAMVVPSVKKEDEAKVFPKGVRQEAVPSEKTYMRYTTDYKD